MKLNKLTTLLMACFVSTVFAAPPSQPDPLANLPYFN